MNFSILISIDSWMEKVLSHPGINQTDMLRKKFAWTAVNVAMFLVIIILTGIVIAGKGHKTFINYMIVLLIGYAVIQISMLIFKTIGLILTFSASIWLVVVSFIYILKLGGIEHSAGLVFVGLAPAFTSIASQKLKLTIGLMMLYLFSIIAAGILHPWLTIPPDMTPEFNNIMFVVTSSLVSVYGMCSILTFIRQRIKMEENEKIKINELNDEKARLYTNITHEFRTPLTVIRGTSDLIKKNPEQWAESGSEKIRENSTHLINLINQMLEISKLDAGKISLNMTQGDIIRHLKYLKESFVPLAVEKYIDIVLETNTSEFIMDFDPDKTSFILGNLISNAVKYTSEYGIIYINIDAPNNGEKRLCIEVRDTGTGIQEENIPKIFDRFFRVRNDNMITGSGLGLSITKEMINLLGGEITVSSTPGKGTDFKVFLPVSNDSPLKQCLNNSTTNCGADINSNHNNKTTNIQSRPMKSEKPIILVVEDSKDILEYLQVILDNDYHVCMAVDGALGFELAVDLVPDIILTDVVMPVMDGIEMLKRIRSDIRTSHIPVIMLTIRADISSKLSGFEIGADAYLIKPFEETELQAILKNLIASRKKLQEHYATVTISELKRRTADNLNDRFMRKIIDLMEANLDNDKYGITELCEQLGMSRAQIYRKFKSLTDKTLHDYLRSYRLTRAKELLLNPKLKISEVAFLTGFKNTSHFSKIFAEEFGKHPSEVRE